MENIVGTAVQLPNLVEASGGILLIYTLYLIYWQLTAGATRRAFMKEHGCKPPVKYSQWDRLFGIDAVFETLRALRKHTWLDYHRDRYRRTGKTFQITLAGVNAINTIEPENIKTMLSLKFKDYHLSTRRKTAFDPLLGRGIFTTDDSDWQHSRELLRPNFVRAQIADVNSFEIHVDRLIKSIPRDGSTVNLQDLFYHLTINSSTQLLFGESIEGLTKGMMNDTNSSFEDIWNRAQRGLLKRMRFGSFLPPNAEFTKDTTFVRATIDHYVEKSLRYRNSPDDKKEADPNDRYIFLRELAKQTDDAVRIRDELLTVMLAGRDTTAGLLTNVWYMLSKRPDVWAKLRSEVDKLEGAQPTFERVKDMKYLRAIMNESLRLLPIVYVNERVATRDTVLPKGGGSDGSSPLFIPKNTNVVWSTCAMHRLPEYFGDDADEYKPERWESLRPGWEYLPFNGGPRTCLGQQFALTGASYTTIRIMQEFATIESRDPEPWSERLTLSCTNDGGAKVCLRPYNN